MRDWILLDGHRTVVSGVTAVGLFIALAVVALSEAGPLRDLRPLYYVLGALISGNLTIVTVVVSINQLLLSRELRTPDELRSQMEGVVDYRRDVEDAADRVAPVRPLGFLRLLYRNTCDRARALGGLALAETDAAVAEEVTEQGERVDALLEDSDAATFRVLSTTLSTNFAEDINRLRRVQWRHGDDLPAEVDAAIEDLVDMLQHIDVARQYFKTIYLQNELASLSRLLFYTGLPSVATVASVLFLFTTGDGVTLARPALPLLLAGAVTVGLLPLVVLFSFILRTATVTQRTAATLPFTAPRQET